MKIWRYDGSFEGFLTIVAQSYLEKILPDKILNHAMPSRSLCFPELCTEIQTREDLSMRVLVSMQKKFGKLVCRRIFHAYLCDDPSLNVEMSLLLYIRLGFQNPVNLQKLSDPAVYKIEQMERTLLREYHKMMGFLRFEELESGDLYAWMSPCCNIIFLLGKYFLSRMGEQSFVIYDHSRKILLISREQKLEFFRDIQDVFAIKKSEKEKKCVSMWRTFFSSVSISERMNSRLQAQLVPIRHRFGMTEFAGSENKKLKKIKKSC